MDRYRVLLVDDEEDIRVGISRKMDWASLGFELVGEAENGREALDLADQLRPDVILTDIKMPFLDGLSLCGLLASRLPASKFVIFSGFDEFEYAKQAIQMHVFEYILKPINAAELSQVLVRLHAQLDSERAERRDVEVLRQRYADSLPVLRELFLAQLLDGRIPPEDLAPRAEGYQLKLGAHVWTVALLALEGTDGSRDMQTLSVQTLFQDHFADSAYLCHAFLYNDALALLLGLPEGGTPNDLIDHLNRGCKLGKSYLDLTLTIGLGALVPGLAQISDAARQARSALDYRVLMGIGRTLYIQDVEPNHATPLSFDSHREQTLTSAIKLGTEEEVRQQVAQLVTLVSSHALSLSQSQLFFLELLTCLLRLVRGADLDMTLVFGEDFSGTLQISDFGSPEELGEWCLARCLAIWQLLRRQRTDSAGRTIGKAKDFIHQNFALVDLSVETLCSHLHLSPAYFSTLFKREMGMSFTSYVTEVRMQSAAELLRNSEDKTYLIAEKVGYSDPNYFSYVFKRHFGVSPTKFRSG